MEIIVGSPGGFCAGVKRAIETLELAIKKYPPPIYVKHEIIHNTNVIESFKSQGVLFIESLDEIVAPLKDKVLIISPHGINIRLEKEARESGLIVIDTTCPLVKKVHQRVEAYEKRNKYEKRDSVMILIGNRNHSEVQGTAGRIEKHIHVVGSIEEIYNLPNFDTDNINYITQTTLNVDKTKELIEALKKKFPNIKGPETRDICYATHNRQSTAKTLAKMVDIIYVIGSRCSSNATKLYEVSKNNNKNAFMVDNAKEIEITNLKEIPENGKIGIVASASTPQRIVEDVVSFLREKLVIKNVKTVLFGKDEELIFNLPIEVNEIY